MQTETESFQSPEQLVREVARLKACFPFRAVVWGAFRRDNPSDTMMGANHTRRQMNDALRKGYVAFTATYQ